MATPQDYLEKIFQVPFSVRPMGRSGFGRLINRILRPDGEEVDIGAFAAAEPPTAWPTPPDVQPAEEVNSVPPPHPEDAAASQPSGTPAASLAEPTVVAPSPRALSISAGETEFARRLHMLLAAPRNAKRFANVYRLLKASLPDAGLPGFEGRQAVAGDFQLPMLLLAILVGKPKLAARLFPRFLASAPSGADVWWQAGWEGLVGEEELALRGMLDPIIGVGYFPGGPQLLVEWLPQVSRYSFTTASIFLRESDSGVRGPEPTAS